MSMEPRMKVSEKLYKRWSSDFSPKTKQSDWEDRDKGKELKMYIECISIYNF